MMNKIVSEIIKFLYNFVNFVAFISNSCPIHGTISIQRKLWKKQEDNVTNRK